MPFDARAYRIMIASPSDVPNERDEAASIIRRWNAAHAEDRNAILLPVGWETHSSPTMGDRAQEILNKQVLEDCDLLIAIFGSRLGSPTGKFKSGTVEEIQECIDSGIPVMIYFSKDRKDMDPEQAKKISEFEKECRAGGLVEYYSSLEEFRQKLSHQLQLTVIREFLKEKANIEVPPVTVTSPPTLSEKALKLLTEACHDKAGDIIAMDVPGGKHIQTNWKNFGELGVPRNQAEWRSAIDQLLDEGLVESRNFKNTMLRVTERGYRLVDSHFSIEVKGSQSTTVEL